MLWDESVMTHLSVLGYDAALGARPLKRAIMDYIINPLSLQILSGDIQEGEQIEVKMEM